LPGFLRLAEEEVNSLVTAGGTVLIMDPEIDLQMKRGECLGADPEAVHTTSILVGNCTITFFTNSTRQTTFLLATRCRRDFPTSNRGGTTSEMFTSIVSKLAHQICINNRPKTLTHVLWIMGRERSDSGTFVGTVSLVDVLGVFNEVRGPVITSSDVADHLDCSTEVARQKLGKLADQNKVDKRKTGRTTVWWETTATESEQIGEIQENVETALDGSEAADTVLAGDIDEIPENRIRATVQKLNLEGTGETQKAREDALVTIVGTSQSRVRKPN